MKKDLMVIDFIDDSINFVHGFECGLIWNKIENGIHLVGYMIHTENSAQVQGICDYFKVHCKIEVCKEPTGWSLLTTHNMNFPDEIFGDDIN